jgi:hypothetical protein
VVLAYPHLFVPQKNNSDNAENEALKYGCELFIYHGSPNFDGIKRQIETAVHTAALEKFGNKIPQFQHPPIKDLSSKENYSGPPGIFIRAKSPSKPGVVKRDPNSPITHPTFIPVTDPDECYAGVIVAASVTASGYHHTSKNGTSKGVTFYINHVLLIRNGERLGRAQRSAEEEFGHLAGQIEFGEIGMPEAAMQTAGMNQYSQPPQHPTQLPPQYQTQPVQYPSAPQQYQPQQYAAPQQYPPVQMPPGYQPPYNPQQPGLYVPTAQYPPVQHPGMPAQ